MSEALVAALRAQGGTLAEFVQPQDRNGAGADPGRVAVSGPRICGREAEYELLLEMILEGSRLHYGHPRFVRPDDPDLALLLGDQLYALGLARLAAIGDLEAVAELADVISLTAQAHAAGDGVLAGAVWDAGTVAIGWGTSDEHAAAKQLVRAGDAGALEAMRAQAARGS